MVNIELPFGLGFTFGGQSYLDQQAAIAAAQAEAAAQAAQAPIEAEAKTTQALSKYIIIGIIALMVIIAIVLLLKYFKKPGKDATEKK